MKHPLVGLARLLNRRSRNGQSLIIIAFAFIALIAFVGIATDVALLFVRFSTLRRSVDAAAIAAAGQMREHADYVSLNAIAKQFIQAHGLDPSLVKVETCETEVYDYVRTHGLTGPDAGKTALDYLTGDPASGNPPPSELCKRVPQKLVRVSAQIASPTTFLSLLGFRTVILQSSSLSQTAALDVALLLDTSLSEAQDTLTEQSSKDSSGNYKYPIQTVNSGDLSDPANLNSPDCYNNPIYTDTKDCNNSDALRTFQPLTNPSPKNIGELQSLPQPWGVGLKPFPADVAKQVNSDLPASADFPNALDNYSDDGNATATKTIRYECWYNPRQDPRGMAGSPTHLKANYAWAGCCNDPTVQADAYGGPDGKTPIATFDYKTGSGFNPNPDWYVEDDPSYRESVIMTDGHHLNTSPDKKDAAQVMYGGKEPSGDSSSGAFKRMKGDGNFSDLMCRPFKDVRDAARRFISRLDFTRGDRVVLVTFNSEAQAVKPYPTKPGETLGSTLPIITDSTTAIRTLNMQVGVEISPNNLQTDCHVFNNGVLEKDWLGQDVPSRYYPNVNITNTVNYWTQAQCVDTNLGGGVVVGTNALIDPNWIRREAVWVMVVLSDGFPNRTPPLLDTTGAINGEPRDWLTVPDSQRWEQNPMATDPGAADELSKYCKYKFGEDPDPKYGTMPQYCANGGDSWTAWGWKWNDMLFHPDANAAVPEPDRPYGALAKVGGQPLYSFGFFPTWTYCKLKDDGTYQPEGCDRQPRPPWWSGSREDFEKNSTSAATVGVSNDPDARHFCMDSNGNINALKSASPSYYGCDPRYDAMDYARDRVDYAALANYTATQKGNFIAMYSIFFNPSKSEVKQNILGVKMMRYIADAGDNGQIDNPIQRWYREARDGLAKDLTAGKAADPLNDPPSGGFAYVLHPEQGGISWTPDQNEVSVLAQPWTDGGRTAVRKTDGVRSDGGTQDWLPLYSSTNPAWAADPYKYDVNADPCAQYDYFYWDAGAGKDVRLNPLSPAGTDTDYQKRAQTNCGQYFYAEDASGINSAFVEISSRLFTRLSR